MGWGTEVVVCWGVDSFGSADADINNYDELGCVRRDSGKEGERGGSSGTYEVQQDHDERVYGYIFPPISAVCSEKNKKGGGRLTYSKNNIPEPPMRR